MNLRALQSDIPLQRHQLVRVFPAAWHALLATRRDLSDEPLLVSWVDRGWPLIVRRSLPGESKGLPLGLPLPPSAGKRRIAVEMQPGDIASTTSLPKLSDVIETAPSAWRPCLQQLMGVAEKYAVQAHVFGSVAWQRLTGLTYLSADSDLDLVWTLPFRDRVDALLADLAEIESRAPMRLDGELVREDGAGVNWRELHAGVAELVVKSTTQVVLCSRETFVGTSA